VAIDSDAHAPGQLAWQPYGCDRAAACGVQAEMVVNTLDADALVAWARAHEA
jgi:histidinol phosphatase-like PHP family hydrolase